MIFYTIENLKVEVGYNYRYIMIIYVLFIIFFICSLLRGGGGGGVQGLKSWKHDFEITVDPKGPPSGSTFWSGFEGPDCGATPLFRVQKPKMANKAQTGIC